MRSAFLFALALFCGFVRADDGEPATRGFVFFRASVGHGVSEEVLTLAFYPEQLHAGLNSSDVRQVPLSSPQFKKAKEMALAILRSNIDTIASKIPEPRSVKREHQFLVLVTQNDADVSSSMKATPKEFVPAIRLAEQVIGSESLFHDFIEEIEAITNQSTPVAPLLPVASDFDVAQ